MNNKNKTKSMVLLGVLSALTVAISFLPLKGPGFEITLSMVPVAVGSIVLGPVGGAVLGAVFGIVSFLQCFGYSPLGVALLSINPLLTAVVCIPTRILAGWLSGVIYKAVSGKSRNAANALSSVSAPIFNTLFFMSALVLCFYRTDLIQGYVTALGASNPFTFILLFVGINAVIEIVAGAVLTFPIAKAVTKYLRK